MNREGQVWVYQYLDGTDRVCLVTRSEGSTHTLLNLDWPLRPVGVGRLDFASEGSLTRHWGRIA